jgi:hypothetical protein
LKLLRLSKNQDFSDKLMVAERFADFEQRENSRSGGRLKKHEERENCKEEWCLRKGEQNVVAGCEFTKGGAKMQTSPTIEPQGDASSMKTRKTFDEQLEALRLKKEAIEKRLGDVEKRKHETDRKLETRRKIIVGGALIAHAVLDEGFRRTMQTALQKSVAAKDKPLVADLIRSGLVSAPPVSAEPRSVSADATVPANESAPPVPVRPTRPGPQAPGKGPAAPGPTG